MRARPVWAGVLVALASELGLDARQDAGWHYRFVTRARENANEQSRRDLLQRERARILELLARYGAHDVRVFGSVARGEDVGRSDIDLLIELPGTESPGGELLTVLGFSEELSELLGVRVDVVTLRTLRSEIRNLALAEAVAL